MRWQYVKVAVKDIEDDGMKTANQRGESGWELVSVVPDHRYTRIIVQGKEVNFPPQGSQAAPRGWFFIFKQRIL